MTGGSQQANAFIQEREKGLKTITKDNKDLKNGSYLKYFVRSSPWWQVGMRRDWDELAMPRFSSLDSNSIHGSGKSGAPGVLTVPSSYCHGSLRLWVQEDTFWRTG